MPNARLSRLSKVLQRLIESGSGRHARFRRVFELAPGRIQEHEKDAGERMSGIPPHVRKSGFNANKLSSSDDSLRAQSVGVTHTPHAAVWHIRNVRESQPGEARGVTYPFPRILEYVLAHSRQENMAGVAFNKCFFCLCRCVVRVEEGINRNLMILKIYESTDASKWKDLGLAVSGAGPLGTTPSNLAYVHAVSVVLSTAAVDWFRQAGRARYLPRQLDTFLES